jgi:hypothetical protein
VHARIIFLGDHYYSINSRSIKASACTDDAISNFNALVQAFYQSAQQLLDDTKVADKEWISLTDEDKIKFLQQLAAEPETTTQSEYNEDDDAPQKCEGAPTQSEEEFIKAKEQWKKVAPNDKLPERDSSEFKDAIKLATQKFMASRSDAMAFALFSGNKGEDDSDKEGLLPLGQKLNKFASECPMAKMSSNGNKKIRPGRDDNGLKISQYLRLLAQEMNIKNLKESVARERNNIPEKEFDSLENAGENADDVESMVVSEMDAHDVDAAMSKTIKRSRKRLSPGMYET